LKCPAGLEMKYCMVRSWPKIKPNICGDGGSPAGRQRAARRASLISAGAGLGPHTRALEIGCGTGLFTDMFAQSGAHITAVDISDALLRKAKARGLPCERVVFLNKRFEDCNVDGPFDAVVGSSVLHHLDIAEALAKIHSLLKPGGKFSFAEPNLLNPQIAVQLKFRRFFDYISPDETAFLSWKIRNLLEAIGFVRVHIKPFDWLHPSTPLHFIGFVKRAGTVLESLPIVRQFSGSLFINAQRRR
jgi:2-polyprenyl-3-methyl-5-hydroxy-6-metoxy-1,4-benzoquinol methylase